jgi:hypothetical protein
MPTQLEQWERAGQEAEARGLAGARLWQYIEQASSQTGAGTAHKISNHGLTVRTRQPTHTHGSSRAGGRTAAKERHPQGRVRAAVGGGICRTAAVGSVVKTSRAGHSMCRYSFFLAAD